MKYFYLSLAILVSAGMLLWQLSPSRQMQKIPEQTQNLEWFGENITMSEMNGQGQLQQIISAQTLAHYMPDNITDLSQVNVHLFSHEQQPDEWHLSSDKGRLFHGEHRQDITRIDLWHHVQLLRPAHDGQTAVTIKTSTLTIFPEKEYAHTDQHTTIDEIGHHMSGDGLEIFFPTQKFYLLNNVSSTHEHAS